MAGYVSSARLATLLQASASVFVKTNNVGEAVRIVMELEKELMTVIEKDSEKTQGE